MKNKKRKPAFTLSEVIITLVVLGIVAAITVPMLSNSASDKKWNVARQKAQATIGEAFKLMTVNGEITDKLANGSRLTTEYLVTKVLPKYLKLEKTCGSGAAAAGNCGFKMVSGSPKIKRPDGTTVNLPLTFTASTFAYGVTSTGLSRLSNGNYVADRSTNNPTTRNYNNSYFFRTLDGFSVNLFYNPYCMTDKNDSSKLNIRPADYPNTPNVYKALDMVCFNAVYDMNGKKGPNQVGKDIGFVGSVFNGYTVQSSTVLPYNKFEAIQKNSSQEAREFAHNYCDKLGNKGEWKLPDLYSALLLYMNRNIVPTSTDNYFYFTTTKYTENIYWYVYNCKNESADCGNVGGLYSLSSGYIQCVRANALK